MAGYNYVISKKGKLSGKETSPVVAFHTFKKFANDAFDTLVANRKKNSGFKLGDMLFIERIAAAVAKGNQSLAQGWSKALAETMTDGSYAQLSKKYFNEDVRCQ
jgi:ABC-type amino acid transport substrate-binding protein